MASATAGRLRFTWFASTAGTAASYSAFNFLIQMLNPATDLSRLVIMVFSATIGGAIAAYVAPSSRFVPCLIVGLLMALQFCDPVFGPRSIEALYVYSAGTLASFAGHSFLSLKGWRSNLVSPELLHKIQ